MDAVPRTSVIFQQASFLAILLPLVSASQKWWEDSKFDVNRDAVLIAIVLVAFVFGTAIDVAVSALNERAFVERSH